MGYKGALSVLAPMGASGIPAAYRSACSWGSDGVRCDADNLTLDHVHIIGSLYWTGSGSLTISNSIVEGGTSFYVIMDQSPKTSTVVATDTTFAWPAGHAYPVGYDAGAVEDGSGNGVRLLFTRDDISGMPQGLDPDADNSVIDSCYIHGLVHTGSIAAGTDSHVDGVFAQGGNNLVVQHSYVDVSNMWDGTNSWATAALFVQDATQDAGYRIIGNYLAGGSYTLYNEDAVANIEGNVLAHGVYGPVQVWPNARTASWLGNVDGAGKPVPAPSH